jgi:hypothetical protein
MPVGFTGLRHKLETIMVMLQTTIGAWSVEADAYHRDAMDSHLSEYMEADLRKRIARLTEILEAGPEMCPTCLRPIRHRWAK